VKLKLASDPRRVAWAWGATAALLGLVTLAVAILEGPIGVPNASATYLLAVVACAVAFGTGAAVVASFAAFLLYDFVFIEPLYTLTIADAGEWLNLLLLLAVGIVVGRLAASQRDRAETAIARERESRALFRISRGLATRTVTTDALGDIVAIVRAESGMARVWVALGESNGPERVVADSAGGGGAVRPASQAVLRRMPGDVPAQWVRVHQPKGPRADRAESGEQPKGPELGYRIRIDAGGRTLGSLWALRGRSEAEPDQTATRLLAGAADQIGQALEQDRLAEEAKAAEIARQSDALKTALLQSVSHDLRTPLATIRAAAGSLLDHEAHLSDADREASAEAIDREAEHLNRLVTNLLDLSRIEAGALRADREAFAVDDLADRTLDRLRPRLANWALETDLPEDLPAVLIDPVFFDQVLTNLIENAIKYVPAGERIRLAAVGRANDVRLTVEDSGPGVPPDALPHLFEKFFRAPQEGRRSRPGTGIGLAVVRGLTDAMGGTVVARRSELGGLAVDLDLPLAPVPEEPGPAAPVASTLAANSTAAPEPADL
jgi:two-component system sensor histidine kinase KdpD